MWSAIMPKESPYVRTTKLIMLCRMQKNITWDTLGFGLEHVAPVSYP